MASNLPENRSASPMWIWLFVALAIATVGWGTASWWTKEGNVQLSNRPFFQVTNRQFSLFAWQFPEYISVSAVPVAAADHLASTDNQTLFLYHTWSRLIKNDYYARPIPSDLFKEFLEQTSIWKPENWPEAPEAYQKFVKNIPTNKTLENASKADLPLEVRIAFQGWQNYHKESSEIEAVTPIYSEMLAFLKASPNYSRNYWRNIVMETTPKYLASINNEKADSTAKIPPDELTHFLKVAYYNYTKARKSS